LHKLKNKLGQTDHKFHAKQKPFNILSKKKLLTSCQKKNLLTSCQKKPFNIQKG
jgi:hypothetical protein